VCVCVCVCVTEHLRAGYARVQGCYSYRWNAVSKSAVDVISILVPQVTVNSSQPQRDFQFQISHVSISHILKIEGVFISHG